MIKAAALSESEALGRAVPLSRRTAIALTTAAAKQAKPPDRKPIAGVEHFLESTD